MTQERTIKGLVCDVHTACVELGMDITPSDVGFIVQQFLQGIIDAPGDTTASGVSMMQRIADEAGSVKDE